MSDNHGFEYDSAAINTFTIPRVNLTPIVKRTSMFYGPNDGISVITESTVPSEVVQKHYEEYKKVQREQALEDEAFDRNNNVQYNIKLNKVVIVGGKQKRGFSFHD
jgi:hypothetical protein